jgi:hypothetical protein
MDEKTKADVCRVIEKSFPESKAAIVNGHPVLTKDGKTIHAKLPPPGASLNLATDEAIERQLKYWFPQ